MTFSLQGEVHDHPATIAKATGLGAAVRAAMPACVCVRVLLA